jgi:hypothetical protein
MYWKTWWEGKTEAERHKAKEAMSIQAKLRNNKGMIREIGLGDFAVKVGDREVPNVSLCRASEIVLEHKYGIKVAISRMRPLKFEVLEGSRAILNDEVVSQATSIALEPREAELLLSELQRGLEYASDEADKTTYKSLIQKLYAAGRERSADGTR